MASIVVQQRGKQRLRAPCGSAGWRRAGPPPNDAPLPNNLWARALGNGSGAISVQPIGGASASLLLSIGSPDDALWSGTGPATLIAVMKAVLRKTAGSTTTASTSGGTGQADFSNSDNSGLSPAL